MPRLATLVLLLATGCPDSSTLDDDAGPGVDTGHAPPGVCASQDVGGEGMCDAEFGPYFLGARCGYIGGCGCVGDDCDASFESEEDCERLNRGCLEGCGAQNARGEGDCRAIVGTYWDGSACLGVGGCSCVGRDCGDGYASVAECAEAHRACPTAAP